MLFLVASSRRTEDLTVKDNPHIPGRDPVQEGWCDVTLLVTGLSSCTLYGLPPSAIADPTLHSSPWGTTLVIKLALVVIIVISALVHDFWIGPQARNSPGFSKIARLFGRVNLLIALLIVIFAVLLRAGGI